MPDLETEWAGVLQRWGNSSQDVRQSDTESLYRQTDTDSLSRQTYSQAKTESHDILGSSRYDNNHDSLDRKSSHYTMYETLDRKSSSKYEGLDRSKSVTSDRKPSSRQEDRKTVDRQTTRDRDWREGGKTGARARWSSVSRGSVSPGKENIETGCR